MAVDQYFTVVLFVFQFYPGYNFPKFINFGLAGIVRSERVNKGQQIYCVITVHPCDD